MAQPRPERRKRLLRLLTIPPRVHHVPDRTHLRGADLSQDVGDRGAGGEGVVGLEQDRHIGAVDRRRGRPEPGDREVTRVGPSVR